MQMHSFTTARFLTVLSLVGMLAGAGSGVSYASPQILGPAKPCELVYFDPGTPPPTPSKWTGDKNVAVILIDLQEAPYYPEGTIPSVIVDQLFNSPKSLKEYWKACSYDKLTIHGTIDDVFGPVYVALPPEHGLQEAWALGALEALEGNPEFDPEDYDLIVFSYPIKNGSRGLPQLDPPGALLGNFSLRALSHEMGHAIGLAHASSLECEGPSGTVTLSGDCRVIEYGDPFDAMGESGTRTYNQQKRGSKGWFDPGNTMHVNNQVSNVKLYPIEAMGNQLKVLRIPRVAGPYGIEQYIYVEFRQPSFFDPIHAGAKEGMGTLIRLGRGYNRLGRSYLLDATPETPMSESRMGALDAPFVPLSETEPAVFTDPFSTTEIKIHSVTTTGSLEERYATVSIDPGPLLGCVYGNPVTVLTPSTVTVVLPQIGEAPLILGGGILSVDFQLMNGDSQFCPPVPIKAEFTGIPPSWKPEAIYGFEKTLSGNETVSWPHKGLIPGNAQLGTTTLTLTTTNLYTGYSTTTDLVVHVVASQ